MFEQISSDKKKNIHLFWVKQLILLNLDKKFSLHWN